jgi:hypothetical protein
MTNAKSELHVQVVDDEIIVTLPGSQHPHPWHSCAGGGAVAMRLSEFLARAWRLANDKARELGWGWVM